ncbi:MAG: OmpA family protein [Treponemataceae bacterium]
MKKLLFIYLFFFFIAHNVFSEAEFSGSIGASFFVANEKIINEKIIMNHKSFGVTANLYFISKINLGLWVKFDYIVPFHYVLQGEKQILTYAFTEGIDFSIGPAYIFRIGNIFSINTALGFNVLQMILAPRISTGYGITADIAFRVAIFSMFSVNLGSSFNYLFSLHLMSASKKYTDYSFFAMRPYLSIGWIGSAGKSKKVEKKETRSYSSYTKTTRPQTGMTTSSADTKKNLAIKKISESVATSNIENISIKSSDTGIIITLEKMRFQRGRSVLFNTEKERINKVAEILKTFANSQFFVISYIETSDTNVSQIALTKERADVIVNSFIELGAVNPNNITAMGSEIPKIRTANASLIQESTRIEVYVVYEN